MSDLSVSISEEEEEVKAGQHASNCLLETSEQQLVVFGPLPTEKHACTSASSRVDHRKRFILQRKP